MGKHVMRGRDAGQEGGREREPESERARDRQTEREKKKKMCLCVYVSVCARERRVCVCVCVCKSGILRETHKVTDSNGKYFDDVVIILENSRHNQASGCNTKLSQ